MFSLKKTSVAVSNKKETELYNKPMTISSGPPSTMGGGFFFPMPTGVEKGDIIYWDPTAGAASTGAWIKLDAPVESATTTEPESLTHNGQSLFWAKVLPEGQNLGDLLYWDPTAGAASTGAWIKLDAPIESATTTEPESLTHNGQSLFWKKGLPRGTAKNQMLYWDPSVGDGGAWVILQEPTFGSEDDPAFLQFTGNLGWGEGGGGGAFCVGLALYTKTVGTPPNTTTQVWIGAGTVAGQTPSGFNPLDGRFIASGGSGNVWAQVNINENTGAVVSVAVNSGSSTPNNTNTSFYYPLGYYEYSGDPPSAIVANYGCGSVDVAVCRNWFVSEPPFYGVSFQRGN